MQESSSESAEMYLKSLAELGGESKPVPIGRVADRLGVSNVSASEMMKRLGEQGFIRHQPYKGVTLTEAGRRLANNVIRRQRLWECFLVDYLQIDWAMAHDLACDLEHATAPVVADALSNFLRHPKHCPHGNPIPDANGEVTSIETTTLNNLTVGQSGVICAVVPESGDVLAYLAQKNLCPGQHVTVVDAAPLKGPLTITVNGQPTDIGLGLAELILIEISQ